MDNVTNPEVILSVKNLVKDFPLGLSSKNNLMRAVNDVSFELRKGEALPLLVSPALEKVLVRAF